MEIGNGCETDIDGTAIRYPDTCHLLPFGCCCHLLSIPCALARSLARSGGPPPSTTAWRVRSRGPTKEAHIVMIGGSLSAGKCQHAPPRVNLSRHLNLSRQNTPPCGGVVFWHVPKTGGSVLECILSLQPEWACCVRGRCGVCHGSCHHRWQVDSRFDLPWGLLGNASRIQNTRFVTAFHQGPTTPTPGLSTDVGLLWHFALLREQALARGCKIVLVTMLRHPAGRRPGLRPGLERGLERSLARGAVTFA